MSEKRKDSKGRVLKDGESQRANGTYDYRYTDIHKKRRCIYAKSLTELRKKEEELWRDLADGIDYAAGEMTVADLVDRYMNLKRGLKPNSLRSYNTAAKRIHAAHSVGGSSKSHQNGKIVRCERLVRVSA